MRLIIVITLGKLFGNDKEDDKTILNSNKLQYGKSSCWIIKFWNSYTTIELVPPTVLSDQTIIHHSIWYDYSHWNRQMTNNEQSDAPSHPSIMNIEENLFRADCGKYQFHGFAFYAEHPENSLCQHLLWSTGTERSEEDKWCTITSQIGWLSVEFDA